MIDQDDGRDGNGLGLLKRRRVTRACDRCHRGGIKCSSSSDPSVCEPCAAFGSVCTYDRPMKRRGPPPTRRKDENASPDSKETIKEESVQSPELPDWTYPNVASHEQISSLIDTYYAIVYPIYPIFHWPTLIRDVRQHKYTTSRPFCVAVLAMCALASARIEDGVSASSIRARFPLPDAGRHLQKSKALCYACEALIPNDLAEATDIDYKRAKIILSSLSMQYGSPQHMHKHLGDYLTMCAVDGFHNESRWPAGLKEYEIQERRRLFYVGYQSDVYAAVTWGGMLHHREAQCNVLYPAEVLSDDDITDSGFIKPPSTGASPGQPVSFLRGWNFVTDLYRLLEHALSQLRTRRQIHVAGNPIDALLLNKGKAKETVGFEVDELLALVQKLHDDLPKEFRKIDGEMTGDENNDRYGFQAANILVTLQTLKMVMAGMAEWSVEQRCAIAGELVDAFATIPITYVQALSCPVLWHLAGVGHLLASILSSPLSPANYLHLRHVLLRMADLVSSIEQRIVAGDIAPRLREHVERIDRFMIAAGGEGGLQAFAAYLEEAVPTVSLQPSILPETSTSNATSGMGNLLNTTIADPSSSINVMDFTSLPSALSSNYVPNGSVVSSATLPAQPMTYQRDLPLRNLAQASEHPPVAAQSSPTLPLHPHRPWIDQYSESTRYQQPPSLFDLQLQPQQQHIPLQQQPAVVPSQAQVQLPDDLFADWSMFLFGETGLQGDAFDFLSGDWQQAQGQGLGLEQGSV